MKTSVSTKKTDSYWKGLVIRAAAVRLPKVGYIMACNVEKENEDIPHTLVYRWTPDAIQKGDRNYNAHSICVIEKPELGFVDVSEQGYYAVTIKSGITCGDILEDSQPLPKKRRFGGFRSVSEIGGKAYAVGLRGMVYRLDGIKKWTRIDDGLPDSFNVQDIHGFNSSDLYAVGRDGELWQYDGKVWTKRNMPTNINFTSVKCADDGVVYIAGHNGILIRGRGDTWTMINHEDTKDDIWDIEWFEGQVYVSTMHSVYCLNGNNLNQIDFDGSSPKSCYQLSATKGVMWSIGEFDIMSFDGKKWTCVV